MCGLVSWCSWCGCCAWCGWCGVVWVGDVSDVSSVSCEWFGWYDRERGEQKNQLFLSKSEKNQIPDSRVLIFLSKRVKKSLHTSAGPDQKNAGNLIFSRRPATRRWLCVLPIRWTHNLIAAVSGCYWNNKEEKLWLEWSERDWKVEWDTLCVCVLCVCACVCVVCVCVCVCEISNFCKCVCVCMCVVKVNGVSAWHWTHTNYGMLRPEGLWLSRVCCTKGTGRVRGKGQILVLGRDFFLSKKKFDRNSKIWKSMKKRFLGFFTISPGLFNL